MKYVCASESDTSMMAHRHGERQWCVCVCVSSPQQPLTLFSRSFSAHFSGNKPLYRASQQCHNVLLSPTHNTHPARFGHFVSGCASNGALHLWWTQWEDSQCRHNTANVLWIWRPLLPCTLEALFYSTPLKLRARFLYSYIYSLSWSCIVFPPHTSYWSFHSLRCSIY